MRCCLFVPACELAVTAKYFLKLSLLVRSGALASTICSLVVWLTTTSEGLYLMTSEKKECMLLAVLNFVFAHGGRKYTWIVKAWVWLTMSFCTGIALSCLDLFACVAVLNKVSAVTASTMVVSSGLVIDLKGSMKKSLREEGGLEFWGLSKLYCPNNSSYKGTVPGTIPVPVWIPVPAVASTRTSWLLVSYPYHQYHYKYQYQKAAPVSARYQYKYKYRSQVHHMTY